MTIKTRAVLKAESAVIRDETSQNANTATRVGQHAYDSNDSASLRVLALGALSPAAMVFEQEGFYSQYTQSGAVVFNVTGAVADGIGQVVYFISDGSNTISFNQLKFDINAGLYGITDGGTLAAGLWKFWLFSENGKINVNVPATSPGDVTAPTITSGTFAADNTYIDILFSEGIYGANDGSTPAALADFALTFVQGAGAATAWTASSAKQNDNTVEGSASALAGGETTIRIFGSPTGVPDGNETLEITPTDGASLYDAIGNAMLSAQTTGAVSLNIGYVFANTHELLVDASSEGVYITNNDCLPSDGSGTDEDVSWEFWYETPGTIGTTAVLTRLLDDNDNSSRILISRTGADQLSLRVIENAASDEIISTVSSVGDILSNSTLYHIVITKTGETFAGIKIYIDGSEVSTYADGSIGSYAGLAVFVGNAFIDIGSAVGGSAGLGQFQIFRQFDAELSGAEITTLYNSGTPAGLSAALQAKCVQENLFNNNPDADNIGNNGVNQGTVTYQAV